MNIFTRRLLPLGTAAALCLCGACLAVATFAQTSQPATAPALSRAEQELLLQLSSADWHARTEAGRSLLERPDITEARLRAMLDQTDSPEASIRLLAGASPKVQGRELIMATPVTLHASNAPAG